MTIYVTILILIDGFLQYDGMLADFNLKSSHNPYFNRWFSAICYKNHEYYLRLKSQSLF